MGRGPAGVQPARRFLPVSTSTRPGVIAGRVLTRSDADDRGPHPAAARIHCSAGSSGCSLFLIFIQPIRPL
jgi:hypothetical protein